MLSRPPPEAPDPVARALAGACFSDKRRGLRRAAVAASLTASLVAALVAGIASEIGVGPVPPPEGPPLASVH